jgi:hypothetical protein
MKGPNEFMLSIFAGRPKIMTEIKKNGSKQEPKHTLHTIKQLLVTFKSKNLF